MALKTREFSPNVSRGLDIESIISAPLIAASVANSMMAKEQARFIMDFCFSKDGDNYHPVMINLTLTNTITEPAERDTNGQIVKPQSIRQVKSTFQLPLLTIIPINSLAVESVGIEFEMEIVSQQEDQTSFQRTRALSGGSEPEKRARLMGKVSYDSDEPTSKDKTNKQFSRNTSNLKVNVNAGQLPLPVGMTTLLQLYMKGIQPIQETEEENNPSAS